MPDIFVWKGRRKKFKLILFWSSVRSSSYWTHRTQWTLLGSEKIPTYPCLVPRRLSSKRARKGRREGDKASVPFPWSLTVHHQSLVSPSPLPCEKRSAWGGGCTYPSSNQIFCPNVGLGEGRQRGVASQKTCYFSGRCWAVNSRCLKLYRG